MISASDLSDRGFEAATELMGLAESWAERQRGMSICANDYVADWPFFWVVGRHVTSKDQSSGHSEVVPEGCQLVPDEGSATTSYVTQLGATELATLADLVGVVGKWLEEYAPDLVGAVRLRDFVADWALFQNVIEEPATSGV